MFHTYLGYALAALGIYSYAQAKGWSIFATEAQAFQAARAQEAEYRRTGSSGGRFGGFSGK